MMPDVIYLLLLILVIFALVFHGRKPWPAPPTDPFPEGHRHTRH